MRSASWWRPPARRLAVARPRTPGCRLARPIPAASSNWETRLADRAPAGQELSCTRGRCAPHLGKRRTARAEDVSQEVATPTVPDDDIAARVERECAEQGIPVGIDDPVTIAKVITLVRAGRASRSATRVAKTARADRPSVSARGR